MWHVLQTRFISKALLVALAFALAGCAGPVQQWIDNTRVHQGDLALANGNVRDADLSYRLALRVDPTDERARAGLVQAAGDLARDLYTKGDFDDALATIAEGVKVDPTSVRLAALKATIDDAKLKREIVISNYPTYREAGVQIERAYDQLSDTNKSILASLKRFSYSFDTEDLTAAIKRSYELELDIARNTNRLIIYRQVVSSGVPVTTHAATSSSAASLLPLP